MGDGYNACIELYLRNLQLLFEELELALSKPIRRLLAWLMIALLEKTRAHLFRLAEKLPDDETTDMARR